jgi:alkylation response protein AidB-like acyl-CoA dehydrogenase
MRFALTQEHTRLAATARKVLADDAASAPSVGRPATGPNRTLLATFADLGPLGLPVAEDLGGTGAGVVELAVSQSPARRTTTSPRITSDHRTRARNTIQP